MKKRRLRPLKILWPFLCIILLGLAACEGPMGPTGATGATGATGQPGGNMPGGTLDISFGDSITVDTVIRICFDPDEFVLSGNKTSVSVPLADYIIYGNQVDILLKWHASEVEPGDYYVYAWTDLDGDDVMDLGPENYSGPVIVYDPMMDYQINFGTMEIETTDLPLLIPNYTFWDDFASEIYLEFNNSWL